MRRILLFVLSGFLLTGTLQAEPPDKEKQQSTDKAGTQKPAALDSSRRSGKPAATFTPTEKIGAGSAVSFPVDI